MRLVFDDLPLFGSPEALQALEDCYNGVCLNDENSDEKVVLIRGPSGVGKSSLVTRLMREEDPERRIFVLGKYNQLQGDCSPPYSALTVALTQLCDIVASERDVVREPCIAAIREAVGNEGILLTDICPRVTDLIGQQGNLSIAVDSNAAAVRLKYVFVQFMRAVCKERMFVLCVDDLQWADESSLELLKALAIDSKIVNFLLIGMYRDDEIDDRHLLRTSFLNCLAEHSQNVTDIRLQNLDVAATNELVAHVLHADIASTRALTTVVHRQTLGNVFFVIQLLASLEERGFITYSSSALRWTWDMDLVEPGTAQSVSATEILRGKINYLRDDLRALLKVASFMDATINVDLLAGIMQSLEVHNGARDIPPQDIQSLLDLACEEGLVDRVGRRQSGYRFKHDQVQQGAYSLIPEGAERAMLHYRIGEILWNMHEAGNSNQSFLYVAVEQLNKGLDLNVELNDEQKIRLAWLNLHAGEASASMSALALAANYLAHGMKTLGRQKWKQHYQLSLRLYSGAAEVAACTGAFDDNREYVDEVLANAHCLEDKIRVFFAEIDSLGAQQEFIQCIGVGLHVLKLLGEVFPRRASKLHVIREMLKTKRMLHNLTDSELLALPQMENSTKIAAMKLLARLTFIAFRMNERNLLALFNFRFIQLTLNFGISDYSAFGMACYGMIIYAALRSKEGFRFGRLAMTLVQSRGNKQYEPQVFAVTTAFLDHWHKPLQDCIDKWVSAHRIAMESGIVTSAFSCIRGYIAFYFYAGLRIEPLENDLRAYCRQMTEYGQHSSVSSTLPYLQAVLRLMGKDEIVVNLEDEDVVGENKEALQYTLLIRAMLGYYFGDIALANSMLVRLANLKPNKVAITHYASTFFEGLVALALARQTRRRKYRARARSVIRTMNSWIWEQGSGINKVHSGINCVHKVLILRAEYLTLLKYKDQKKQEEDVRKLFDEAIAQSRRIGFLQDAALANELAGDFFARKNDDYWAGSYATSAYELYVLWGAIAKADDVTAQHTSVSFEPSTSFHNTSFRSRRRFTTGIESMHRRISGIWTNVSSTTIDTGRFSSGLT